MSRDSRRISVSILSQCAAQQMTIKTSRSTSRGDNRQNQVNVRSVEAAIRREKPGVIKIDMLERAIHIYR